jgi:hypothetical protein
MDVASPFGGSTAMSPVMPPVHQMHQRASEQRKVRQSQSNVGKMEEQEVDT